MATTFSGPVTSALLREVDKTVQAQSSKGEILVVIDSQGDAYAQKPAGIGFFKSYRYFIVKTAETAAYNGFLCALRYQSEITKIVVEYQVKCQPKDAQRYAAAAYRESPVGDMIQRKVQAVVEEYHKAHNLTDDFNRKKPSVETLINERLEACGLTVLSVNISLDGGPRLLEALNIKVDVFKVSLLGSIPKASMGLEAVIVTKPGREAKSLNKVLTAKTGEEEILRMVRGYIAKNVTTDELYNNFNFQVKQQLERLINEGLFEYGKELEELSLSLHKNGSLDAIVLRQEQYLDGRIKNSHQLVQFKYKCELVADPRLHARVYLFPANTAEIEEVIKDQIKETLATEIDAEQFADELNTSVSARLAEAVNLRISSWGRRVGYLQLETDSSMMPPKHVEINHNIECQTKDGHTITIKNTLLLQRNYYSKRVFEATQTGSLEEWGKKELDRITKKFIINRTYNELLYAFSDEDLREEMQQEADKLGYDVNQLITIPEFKGEGPLQRFKIMYKDYNISSKVDGIPVAISLSIEGKIVDYSKIMKLIAPKESVTDNMEKAIDNKIRQFFHSIEPERFYVRFYSQDNNHGDTNTLEQEIKQIITNVLSNDYGAEVRDIVASPLNTKLILRLKQLQEGKLECRYCDKTGLFDYKSTIKILGVDQYSWAIFNSKGYKPRSEDANDTERVDIVSHVKDFLENALNTRIVPSFKMGVIKNHDDFVADIEDAFPTVMVQVKEIFGLNIDIIAPVKITPEAELNRKLMESKIRIASAKMVSDENVFNLSQEQRSERLLLLYKLIKETDEEGYAVNSLTREKIASEIKLLETASFNLNKSIEMGDPFDALLLPPSDAK